MSYLAPLPESLQQVEVVRLYFTLQLQESFDLPTGGLLQLRRELLQALRTLEGWGRGAETEQLRQLFRPPLPDDPLLRKRAQQPAPAFVLQPDVALGGLLQSRQRIELPVLLLGRGMQALQPFVVLLQQLGQQGLYCGSGRFLLEAAETEDGSGVRSMLWSGGQVCALAPPISDLYWLLERQLRSADELQIELLSPLRLLQRGKPLFKTDFVTLFPFLLRRVGSMLACHAGVEPLGDPQRLLQLAAQVEVIENRLRWQDWRRLQGETASQELGGLVGSLRLQGEALGELLWLLQLGSLLNLGKGAAYGAGHYRLNWS